MKKILTTALLAFMLAGCNETIAQKVYVDKNGVEIKVSKKYKQVNLKIVCDQFGNAYYETPTQNRGIIHILLFCIIQQKVFILENVRIYK